MNARFIILGLFLILMLAACGQNTYPSNLFSLRQAALANNADAQFKLAAALHDNHPDEEIFWYKMAARRDHTQAIKALAALLRQRAKSKDEYIEATSWNIRSAATGDADAAYFLGFVTQEGVTKAGNKTALDWFLMAAQNHHPGAMYELGKFYESNGDYAQAAAWYFESARGGDSNAKLALSDIYIFGRGLPANIVRAMEYLQQVAAAGKPAAQYNLARFYEDGKYLPEDPRIAGYWYGQAAAHGVRIANFKLQQRAERCLTGEILDTEMMSACFAAAGVGDNRVDYRIARILEDAAGYNDFKASHGWFIKAALGGNEDAPRHIFVHYYLGLGAPRDMAKAYSWLVVAGVKEGRDSDLEKRLLAKLSRWKKVAAVSDALTYEDMVYKRCSVQNNGFVRYRTITDTLKNLDG